MSSLLIVTAYGLAGLVVGTVVFVLIQRAGARIMGLPPTGRSGGESA